MSSRNLDDPLRGYGLDSRDEDDDRPPTGIRVLGGFAAVAGLALILLAVLAMTGMLGSGSARDDDGSASGGGGGSTASATEDSTSDASPTEEEEPPPDPNAKAPLTVLNNTTTQGLAAQAADSFAGAGWEISNIGTLADASVTETTVFYTEGSDEEEAAAKALQEAFPQIASVEPRPPAIPYTGVVVVLISF